MQGYFRWQAVLDYRPSFADHPNPEPKPPPQEVSLLHIISPPQAAGEQPRDAPSPSFAGKNVRISTDISSRISPACWQSTAA